jgi:hypothetical protein
MYELTDQSFPFFYDSLSRELLRLLNEQKSQEDVSILKDNQKKIQVLQILLRELMKYKNLYYSTKK